MNEGLCTPSKGPRPSSNSSPSTSTRSTTKRATKNAKITNFFTKVNSPSNRNNSNSNHDRSENDHNQQDELSKDASSSSMKIPDSAVLEVKKRGQTNKDYVFIIPSSDDDTNVSAKGSQGRRRKPPSVHSNNSKSSDGLILTNNNNELGIGRRKKGPSSNIHNISEKAESNSNPDLPNTPSSGRDSRSRDSLPEKRRRTESASTTHSTNNNSGGATAATPRITRIQPTMISSRTKMIDFQSVPSDLNLPRAQAMEMIEELFFVKMPEDFFLFWDFAKTINHRKPCSAFSHAHLDWTLVGPYDVLSGLITNFHGFSKGSLARHCRFYYDPPEFQTVVIRRDACMTHYGYYRDDPKQDNPIVVANRTAFGGQISEMGDNLFTLLRNELDSSISLLSNSSQEIPPLTFSSSSSRTPRGKQSTETSLKQSQLERAKAKQELTIIRDKLIDFCSTHENLSSESWSRTNTRKSRRCTGTLNSIGIVVPNTDETIYKGLDISDSELEAILTEISESKEDTKSNCSSYEKYVQLRDGICYKLEDNSSRIASLKLGLDLLSTGDSFFHKDIETLLTHAYTRLSRAPFLEILKSHLEERKRGSKVSLLEE